jgi:hypothetical protein
VRNQVSHPYKTAGYRAHQTFYSVGGGSFFPGDKAAWAWHWPLTSI